MRKRLCKILVTGGAGFIGSEFVRQSANAGYRIAVVDKLTYAGDLRRLEEVKESIRFYKADICNRNQIELIMRAERPEIVIHFAAESHVDRSIIDSSSFLEANISGTQIILDAAKRFNIQKYIHISTDEVYGEITNGKFNEDSPLGPGNPYAVSKASGDLLVKAYIRTYKIPAIIIRPSNNYGPWQYPEKFIPVAIYKALKSQKIPVYGEGLNRREWLYVSDCAKGIRVVLEKGSLGEIYNLGSGEENKNIEIAKNVLRVIGKSQKLIQFVRDRPGHDFRYSLDSSKIHKLGWQAQIKLQDGIADTILWYQQNFKWLQRKAGYLKNYWKTAHRKK